ncbi:hypothetical protein [Chryseobacterium rhizoplanae]|uniref:hypothetical protein n=1 Tax=Chryseobacterium rhizoplanae TaxID=1609531 RepID=UPI00142ECDD3|nr:hypothetical protein [Chryseobacterium rhizoplanae]
MAKQNILSVVDSTHAKKPGSKWIFKENIFPEHPESGTIVLDILEKDQLERN